MESDIGRWSHREYRTRLAWIEMQWNEPDKTDHYLMQIAQRVQQVLSEQPNKITLEQQEIPFVMKKVEKGKKVKGRVTTEQATKWMKAKWMAAVGYVKGK